MSSDPQSKPLAEQAPVIGWEKTTPVPDGYRFNSYLVMRNGNLYMEDLNLPQVLDNGPEIQGLEQTLPSPLELVYLPLIRRQIKHMNETFAAAIAATGYGGRFLYAYASKANAAEEVIRTTLGAGAHHEMSSTVDVSIARIMIGRGLLPPDRLVICNGFKGPGTDYSRNIIRLRDDHEQIIPVLEDLDELSPLISCGKYFDVGLRQKTYGPNETLDAMEAANSRFGMDLDTIWKAAGYIAAAPNLNLRLYHAMVGSQITDKEAFVDYLSPGIEVYAPLPWAEYF